MMFLFYLLSIAMHYVLLALETSKRAELLSREAEFKALKAQVNPHFLFNSLNSISALTSIDAAKARRDVHPALRLLKKFVAAGGKDQHSVQRRDGADRHLSGRGAGAFRPASAVKQDFAAACAHCEVPPLLLQPLVENAIKHGIAALTEGGEIAMTARIERGQLRFTVENPFDPDAPAMKKSGFGLVNVRNRLAARYGNAARLEVAGRTEFVPRDSVSAMRRYGEIMSIRAILVDDEDLARQILREYLSQEEDVEIVAECNNGFDAVKAIAEYKPDLAFLDVQMPKLDGFEVLELVDTELAVVFVTAYDQYAMKAFEAAAVDYLLKPFDAVRLRTALEKARRRLGEGRPRPRTAELKQAARRSRTMAGANRSERRRARAHYPGRATRICGSPGRLSWRCTVAVRAI